MRNSYRRGNTDGRSTHERAGNSRTNAKENYKCDPSLIPGQGGSRGPSVTARSTARASQFAQDSSRFPLKVPHLGDPSDLSSPHGWSEFKLSPQ